MKANEVKRMQPDLSKSLSQLADIASQMTYVEWCRAVQAIDKKFASEHSKVKIENPEAFKRMLRLEFDDIVIQ